MAFRGSLSEAAPWKGRVVVLGVTGGIAAYKSVQLARDLTLLGARLEVVLTDNASRFIGRTSFEGVTGRSVLDSLWSVEGSARHLSLAREADLVLVAPATADLLARAAQGRSDDLLTAILLATRAPVLLAPAMNHRMWEHSQTQANALHLEKALGYRMAGPVTGPLAAGEGEGPGRMMDPEELVEWAGRLLSPRGAWDGRRVLVTAGPTHEPLDAVRFLGNRSSGQMGFALAREAWLRGADVTLITGPSTLPSPVGVEMIRVETAREMHTAVQALVERSAVNIFAAAVADFRPETPEAGKRKRVDSGPEWEVRLVENPDIARESRERRAEGSVTVGFALETEELEARAREKMEAKGFDLVVANPAQEPDAGFDAPTNRVVLLGRDGLQERLPLLSKFEVARRVLDRVEPLLERKESLLEEETD